MARQTVAQAIAGLDKQQMFTEPFESWSDDSRAVVIDTESDRVLKRFTGESAWSNANRYASDLYTAQRYGTH